MMEMSSYYHKSIQQQCAIGLLPLPDELIRLIKDYVFYTQEQRDLLYFKRRLMEELLCRHGRFHDEYNDYFELWASHTTEEEQYEESYTPSEEEHEEYMESMYDTYDNDETNYKDDWSDEDYDYSYRGCDERII